MSHNVSVDMLGEGLEHLLAARYSCRGFKPDAVERSKIDHILAMAQRTPSWCNTQPWRMLIQSGEAARVFSEGLLGWVKSGAPIKSDIDFPLAYEGVYRDRRRECGHQLYDSVGIAATDRAASQAQALENFKLFGAPHVAIVTTDRSLGCYGVLDCGAYVSNFTLAARSLGVAAIAQAAFAHHADFVRDHLRIADDRLVVCGISFGYEDEQHRANGFRTTRAAIEDVVTFIDG